MIYINKITIDPVQRLILTGIPQIQITMDIRFMPRVQRWIMNLAYGDTVINGIAIVSSLNLLRQFKDNIPFGMTCIMADGLDPYKVDVFATKTANLYLLDSTDVATIEGDWFE